MNSRRAAIGIGVGLVRGMPRLDGARSDAERFLKWAARNTYETKAFIDEDDAPVGSDAIRRFIRELTESGDDISRLLIYFSGHGASTATTDNWLLSGFGEDGDECINVELSRRSARQHPLGQVALIADACRSAISPALVPNGRNLFPIRPMAQAVARQPKLDLFFATRLGADAQEVVEGDRTKSYGVFSRCLFSALEGQEVEAVDSGRQPQVVSSQSLADWLERHVPMETGRIPGGVVQMVDVTAGWGRPEDWYAELAVQAQDEAVPDLASTDRDRPVVSGLATSPGWKWLDGIFGDGRGQRSRPRQRPTPVPAERERSAKVARARVREARERQEGATLARRVAIVDAAGRQSFETHQGITVVGATIVDAITDRRIQDMDVFQENGTWHVRCACRIQSVALRLGDGRWTGVVTLPEHIATVLVNEAGVASVNYTLSANSPLRAAVADPNAYTDAVARWSALEGTGMHADPVDLRELARKVRMGKHANPTLGILAAYAYDRGGVAAEPGGFDSVDSVAGYFGSVNRFVPFDVAFLSSTPLPPRGQSATFHSGKHEVSAPVAGGFPLMTRGWGLIDEAEPGIDRDLLALRGGLLPGLWNCFDGATGERFAELVAEGRV